MPRDVFVLLLGAAVSYGWLCAIVSPLATSARSVTRNSGDSTGWSALALSCGSAVLWTAAIAGAVALLTLLEPAAGRALWKSEAAWRGVTLGNIIWACQLLAWARIPRFGQTFETATALAMVAFVRDDPWTLSRVERLYRAHATRPEAAVSSGAMRRVAA